MVLVEEPEAEDSEALLSGPEGRLLDAMLAAFGLKREDAYLASVLPRHKPAPDWNVLMQQGIGQVIAHHIGLAAPERLLVTRRPLVLSDLSLNAIHQAAPTPAV